MAGVPWLARDLARAAAAHPKATWCLTVTDQEGHAIGHGCARLMPKNQRNRPSGGGDLGAPSGPGPPDPPGATSRDGPGFSFGVGGRDGPPGGYGSWRFTMGVPGRRDLRFALDPIATEACDHRFEAAGHDPGRTLRHLAQMFPGWRPVRSRSPGPLTRRRDYWTCRLRRLGSEEDRPVLTAGPRIPDLGPILPHVTGIEHRVNDFALHSTPIRQRTGTTNFPAAVP